jgi:hypothetical protein
VNAPGAKQRVRPADFPNDLYDEWRRACAGRSTEQDLQETETGLRALPPAEQVAALHLALQRLSGRTF